MIDRIAAAAALVNDHNRDDMEAVDHPDHGALLGLPTLATSDGGNMPVLLKVDDGDVRYWIEAGRGHVDVGPLVFVERRRADGWHPTVEYAVPAGPVLAARHRPAFTPDR